MDFCTKVASSWGYHNQDLNLKVPNITWVSQYSGNIQIWLLDLDLDLIIPGCVQAVLIHKVVNHNIIMFK